MSGELEGLLEADIKRISQMLMKNRGHRVHNYRTGCTGCTSYNETGYRDNINTENRWVLMYQLVGSPAGCLQSFEHQLQVVAV